ncbi:rhomboid family intramembrane serine protease [Clostridiales bacterium COT073_COT-073]|nr:rhomboid family intramembrane serine protease [Clostridiales bacterium COT073_COT-073]
MEKQTAIDLVDKLLRSRGIQAVNLISRQDDGASISGHRIYFDFRKSNLYVVSLISEEERTWIEEQSQMLRTLIAQNRLSADRIFALNLLLTTNAQEQMSWQTPELEAKVIELFWILDYSAERIIFPPNQPTAFLNLEKELVEILSRHQVTGYVMGNTGSKYYLSYGLILINGLMWLITEILGGSLQTEVLLQMGAMNVLLVLNGEWYRLLTAMFLHIGITHLVMNSAGIYIFGSRLEKQISAGEMLIIYLLGGLVGNIVSFGYHFWNGDFYVVAAGASGGVYALMGALLSIAYLTKKKAGGLDAYAIFLYFLIGLIGSVIDIQIDLAAHLGGFAVGLLLAALFARKRKQLL